MAFIDQISTEKVLHCHYCTVVCLNQKGKEGAMKPFLGTYSCHT